MSTQLRDIVLDDRSHTALLGAASAPTARILDRALNREELTVEDGVHLLGCKDDDLRALIRTADVIRAEDVGDEVTYVVNRNINWTNICFVGCQFCAFAVHRKDPSAYNHSIDDVLVKVQDAIDRGASEVCMQGGINPELDGMFYRDLLVAIKAKYPKLHVHAFSPMEIMYGSRRANMSYREFLSVLRDAGLGTIPGTAAEILDDDVREILSHKKVDVGTWVEIVTTAHELGLRSSSTIMYGHIETPEHVARHVVLLRDIQKRTGGFTEFVPLRFIHTFTQLFKRGLVQPPPSGENDFRMYAFSRLMLRGWIDNLQTSWVKLGTDLSQLTLMAGCNDFGGTLMEESISKSAGADAGEYLPADTIRDLILEIDRIPVQRNTTYGHFEEDRATAAGDRSGGRSGCGEIPARAVAAP